MERKKSYVATIGILSIFLLLAGSFYFILPPKAAAEKVQNVEIPESKSVAIMSATNAITISAFDVSHDDHIANDKTWLIGTVMHIDPRELDTCLTDQIIFSWNTKYFTEYTKTSTPIGEFTYYGRFMGSDVFEDGGNLVPSELGEGNMHVSIPLLKKIYADGWKWSTVTDITCIFMFELKLKEGETPLYGDMIYMNYQHNSVSTEITGITMGSNGMINGVTFTNNSTKSFIAAASANLNR